VLAYEDIGGMEASVPTVFVDIAGNSGVRASVHAQFGDALKYSCAVGATHWDAPRQEQPLAGPAPKMFFAPDVVKKRDHQLGAGWLLAEGGRCVGGFPADSGAHDEGRRERWPGSCGEGVR